MRKIFLILLVLFCSAQIASAFVFQMEIKDKETIRAMKNDQLADVYLQAIIEKKAGETFYSNSSFTPQEYNKYKNLLTYIVRIREEMVRREMEPPPYEEWLK